MDQRIESHPGQQRNKQEDAGRPGSDTQWFVAGKDQRLSIRDCRNSRRGVVLLARGSVIPFDRSKKGEFAGASSATNEHRNWCIN